MPRRGLVLLPSWFLIVAVVPSLPALNEDEVPGADLFTRGVLPLLEENCLPCHGERRPRNRLRLQSMDDILAGGLNGPAIVPGQPDQSLLLQAISYEDADLQMPPDGKLPASAIETLTRWVKNAEPMPAAPLDRPVPWAFRPVQRPELPDGADATTHPVDTFITARLRQEGLTLSPPADRRTLLRRLSFDLVGMPPSPEQLASFVADPDPWAYERRVDELLASPRYGERWARHWLDVVRFAETHGFEVNTPRPNAWPYRDYVIRALNEDRPYPQFILEQLAGDAVGEDAATGFLVAGPWDAVKSPDVELTRNQRDAELHDMVSTTSSVFLGLTMGCAKCHHHKFDPLSQQDYYRLRAFFSGVQHGDRELRPPDHEPRRTELAEVERKLTEVELWLEGLEPLADPTATSPETPRAPVSARINVDRFEPIQARAVRFTVQATNNREPCLDELEVYAAGAGRRNVALATTGAVATASSVYPNSEIHRLAHLHDGLHGNSHSWISNEVGAGWVQIELPGVCTIDRVVWGRDREQVYADRLATAYRIEVQTVAGEWCLVATSGDRAPPDTPAEELARTGRLSRAGLTDDQVEERRLLVELHTNLTSRREELANRRQVYAGRFDVEPEPTHFLHRGDPMQPRDPVTPATPARLSPALDLEDDSEQGRRLALARWIADPAHPLTARVLVNRVWHYHFGRGLVATPSDFGEMGSPPSHPELLDWLAVDFIDHGFSLKHLHRRIVTSDTFQQSSAPSDAGLAIDADAVLLWRFPPRRLEAEAIRDSMLQVTGKLDLTMGGPGFSAFQPNENYVRVYEPKQEFGPTDWRRMVYQTKARMEQDSTFGAFDCPDGSQTCPARTSSTTPLQALNLLNSPFVLQQAGFLAERLAAETGEDPTAQVELAFQLVFQRPPDSAEATAARELVEDHGLPALARALFNASEFLYLE